MMRSGALSTSAVVMALVAVSIAGPVAAGPILCGDIADPISVHLPCNGKWAQVQLHDASPTPIIPEPGPLALLGIGLVGVALARHFKRR